MNYFEPFDNVGEAFSWGMSFSIFGFATVFAVLAIIMFVVIIFGKIFSRSNKSDNNGKKTEQPKQQVVVKEEPAAPAAVEVNNDGGIIAAIVAAISAFRSANGEGKGGFRVVSFKKRK